MTTKLDFHSHYLFPGLLDIINQEASGLAGGVRMPTWSIDQALKMMADQEIDYSLLSVPNPEMYTGEETSTVDLAREANQYGRDFHQAYPDKLGFMASLPLPYIDESVAMVKEALDEDNADGFILKTNVDGLYLGDPRLDPIMAELNAHNALIAIHPEAPTPENAEVNQLTPDASMEFFFDTTRTVVNMTERQIFSRFPNINWIVPHAGAVLPVIAQRISAGAAAFGQDHPQDDIMAVMNHVYFDVAGMVLPYQLPLLMQMADSSKLLYGADYPYTPAPAVTQMSQLLETTPLLSASTKAAILYQNGEQLLRHNQTAK
ncbi:hypothetical protein AYR62_13830 [Secundilactobacillus paracollinoides]|uniref:amidohydrolase family protein n=2 Tax=Secundilactobacillus paracollinoides TaxID=240427 RepID=UPI0006F122E1|nr:amidohydrolase family protein [Secundilactobacillus paracollinoides]ANZ65049.1 hypothetical protein AYR62_13830 [Secundilactobacillus paracollinoides]KRL77280.1 hypothetical protein FC17_GL001356 [Secundilactobacillus paracollinoides DSM 15502 = JCM 11969]